MGEKSKRAIDGAAEKTAAVQLLPVSYQIKLHYMGHDRIKHVQDQYRCKYELLKETGGNNTSLENAPAVIPNVVRNAAPDSEKAKPALPSGDGGNTSNPAADEVRRIVIQDNHGVSKADLNSVFGGALSKPKAYEDNSWLPAVKPKVPFRVVVTKLCGDAEVPMKDDLEVVIEIKDPKEELAQTDGKRKDFLEKFFKKYNRTDADPDPGDDNALEAFAGIRKPSAAYSGVDASKVIKKIPYKKPPEAGEGPGTAASVNHGDLAAATKLGTERVVIAVEKVKLGQKDVGVADFAIEPPPVGGDNYRFLLSLQGKIGDGASEKSDIRKQELNGEKIKLFDDDKKLLQGACCYATGRFVIWRRIKFRMVVTCNGLNKNDIDFASMTATYRKSFIILDEPAVHFVADWKVWRDALKERYAGNPTADPWFADGNKVKIELAYAQGLVPAVSVTDSTFKMSQGGTIAYTHSLDADVHALTRYLIKRGCDDSTPKLTDPNDNDQVSQALPNSDGLFLLYSKAPMGINDGTLGEYIGDRIFYMYNSTDPADTTYTCGHELGHALFLSHSLTGRLKYTVDGAAVNVMEATGNCALHDHDQNDAATCLMGYISGDHLKVYPYDPCGACSLALRQFNKVEFQKKGEFGQKMMESLKNAAVFSFDGVGVATAAIPNVRVGEYIRLVFLGKEVDWPKTGGTWKARLNLTGLGGVTTEKTGAGNVSFGPIQAHRKTVKYCWVKGVTAGKVRAKFSYYGIEATSAEFSVTTP